MRPTVEGKNLGYDLRGWATFVYEVIKHLFIKIRLESVWSDPHVKHIIARGGWRVRGEDGGSLLGCVGGGGCGRVACHVTDCFLTANYRSFQRLLITAVWQMKLNKAPGMEPEQPQQQQPLSSLLSLECWAQSWAGLDWSNCCSISHIPRHSFIGVSQQVIRQYCK